jgi:O-antigen ligase
VKKNNIYRSTLIFCLTSIAYLLPNYYDPWRTVYHDFTIYGVLLCLLIKILLENNNILINKRIIFIYCVALIPLLQNLFGKIYFFGDALIASIYIFSFGLAVTLGLNLRRNYKLDQILIFFAAIFIFVGLVSAFIILKQWLLLSNGGIWTVDMPPRGRPFANFAQPNNCASFLLISSLATLYIFEKKIINYFSAILLAGLFIFCLALTQSRMVWVFSFCFLIWWFWKSPLFSTRLTRYSIGYYLGFFLVALLSIPYLSDLLGVTSTSDIVTRATTGYLRIPMWNQMLLAISQEPLWGYGWNQVSVAQLSVFLDYPTTEWTEHSHNIFLDLLIWNGIPIGTLIIGFLSYWLWQLSRRTNSLEVFISLSMIGVLIVHGMLEYPLEYAFFLLPVGFILGLISFDLNSEKIIHLSKNLGVMIFISAISLFIWIFIEYRSIEKDFRLLQFELKNIGSLHAKHEAPDIILLTQLRERIRFLRTEPLKNMTQEQLAWMKQVTYRYGTSINLHRYSQALLLNDQNILAREHLKILNELHGVNETVDSLFNSNDSLSYRCNQQQVSKP